MSAERSAVTLAEIPSQSQRIHFSWGLGNELFCCDVSSKQSTISSSASCVQWGCMSSAQRRIAYDTAPAFQQLQQKLASDGDGNVLHTVSKYSKGITEVLASAEEAGDESADTMSLYQERGLWELISLFFIDAASSDGFVPQDLSRWLQSNATSVYSGAANTPLPAATLLHLQEAALPETNPAYWRSFHKLVALGWISSALELLALHSAWLRWDGSSNEPDVQAQVSALEAVSLLLRRFPSLAGHGAAGAGGSRQFSSSAEYNKYRKAWQAQCTELAQNTAVWSACAAASRPTSEALRLALLVLAGSSEALKSVAENWVEYLVARIMHEQPAAHSLAEVRHVLRECIADKQIQGDFMATVANVLDACCDMDPQTALQACSEMCSDWFLAHIPDVLAASSAGSSMRSAELPHHGGTQSEFYILDYAMAVAPHTNTHNLAASYLAWCPVHGQSAFERVVKRLPLSEADYQLQLDAGRLCEDFGLAHVKTDLHVLCGVSCLERGLIGAALVWLLRAGDRERLDAALAPFAAQLLQGQEVDSNIVDLIGRSYSSIASSSAVGSIGTIDTIEMYRQLRGDNQGTNLHAALNAVSALPVGTRSSCTELFTKFLKNMKLNCSEDDILLLLSWFEEQSQVTATTANNNNNGDTVRLQLLRLLAATQLIK